MSLHIGDEVPNFTAETTEGTIQFHDWIGDGWAVLFSHPKDFTPVCTTELGYVAGLGPEFAKRNCKVIGLSVDSVDDHASWSKDIEETQGHAVNYPLIGDTDLSVAKLFDMIHPNATGSAKGRTAADNATVRSVFVIGPDKKIKLMITYPMTTGRNFDEVLRVIDSMQLTAETQSSHTGELEAGRRRYHRPRRLQRRSQGKVSRRLEVAQAVSPHRPATGLDLPTPRRPIETEAWTEVHAQPGSYRDSAGDQRAGSGPATHKIRAQSASDGPRPPHFRFGWKLTTAWPVACALGSDLHFEPSESDTSEHQP